jgi:hypothetical protein
LEVVVVVVVATRQIWSQGDPGQLPLHSSSVLGFQWVNPVGRILATCLYAGHGSGESGTDMTSIGSSSSSSSATVTSTISSASVTPSSPSLIPGDDNTGCLSATGYSMSPYRGWRRAVPGDPSERWLGLRVPSTNRPVVWGRETAVVV